MKVFVNLNWQGMKLEPMKLTENLAGLEEHVGHIGVYEDLRETKHSRLKELWNSKGAFQKMRTMNIHLNFSVIFVMAIRSKIVIINDLRKTFIASKLWRNSI